MGIKIVLLETACQFQLTSKLPKNGVEDQNPENIT